MKNGNLRKQMDMINRNSTYGLVDAERFDRLTMEACNDLARIWNVGPGEIRKIVEDYIKGIAGEFKPLQPYPKPPIYVKPVKLMTLRDRIIEESTKELQNKVDKLILKEEATMHEDCYFCIKRGICTGDVPKPCNYRYTEDERKADQASDQYCAILNDTYLPKTYRKERNEMKATSTQTFKDIIAVDFELQSFPNENDKFIVSATNRDDIFCFVFEGSYLADTCRKAGLFSSWEKDQKIKELEEELGRWKKEAADCLRLRDEARKENEELKQQLQQVERDKKRITGSYKGLDKCYNGLLKDYHQIKDKLDLERAANEAHHRFFHQYAGKGTEIEFNYAISDCYEVSYVIVDKEEYQTLKAGSYCAMIHGKVYNTAQLVDRILELEALKTPTIENFADEKPSDNVNHPSHYTGRYECIDVMQDVFGNEATDNFCLCNAFKYIWRANKKNGLEDVKKAVWYLNKYIEEAEKDGVRKGKQV